MICATKIIDKQRVGSNDKVFIFTTYFFILPTMIKWIFVSFLLSINIIEAQTPTLLWSKFVGTSAVEYPDKILAVPNGFLILGRTETYDTLSYHLNENIILIRTDTAGNLIWNSCYGGDSSDIPHDIIPTSDGNFLIVGSTNSMEGDVTNNHFPGAAFGGWGTSDFWVIKIDTLGNKIWQSCYGGSGSEEGYCAVDLSDSYMIFGSTEDSNDGDVFGNHSPSSYDIWAIKIDTAGVLLWQKCIGGSSGDLIEAVVKISNDSILLGATSYSNDGDATFSLGQYDFWPVLIDSSANILTQNKLGGSWYENCHSIVKGINGGYVLTGSTSSNDINVNGYHGSADIWVVRTDDSGNFIWQSCLGGTEAEVAFKIISSRNNYYVVGYSASINGDLSMNNGHDDLWIVQLDSIGNISWQQSYGGSLADGAFDITMENDSVIVIVGASSSNDFDVTNNPGGDIWLLKFKLDFPTDVQENNFKNSIVISPNPSYGTVIIYAPNNSISSKIIITDAFGKTIYFSENNKIINGKINLSLDVPSGVYLINCIIDGKAFLNKLIVQK